MPGSLLGYTSATYGTENNIASCSSTTVLREPPLKWPSPDLRVAGLVLSWCPVCLVEYRPVSDCDSKVYLLWSNARHDFFDKFPYWFTREQNSLKIIIFQSRSPLTVCEGVEGFPRDIQNCKSWALGLRGPPAGQGSLKGRGPVTDHSQGLPLYWDDLSSLWLGGVGVRLGH